MYVWKSIQISGYDSNFSKLITHPTNDSTIIKRINALAVLILCMNALNKVQLNINGIGRAYSYGCAEMATSTHITKAYKQKGIKVEKKKSVRTRLKGGYSKPVWWV